MADPASAAARAVDQLTDVPLDGLPMTDVDRIEADLLAEHGEPIEQLPVRTLSLGGYQRGSGRRFLSGQCHLHPTGDGCRCTQ